MSAALVSLVHNEGDCILDKVAPRVPYHTICAGNANRGIIFEGELKTLELGT
jgi:hypothetical protein